MWRLIFPLLLPTFCLSFTWEQVFNWLHKTLFGDCKLTPVDCTLSENNFWSFRVRLMKRPPVQGSSVVELIGVWRDLLIRQRGVSNDWEYDCVLVSCCSLQHKNSKFSIVDILVADLAPGDSDLLPRSAHHVQPLLCFMIGRIQIYLAFLHHVCEHYVLHYAFRR